MPLLDLSLVTKTLINVVRESINASSKKPPGTVTVTSLPPHALAGDNAVGLYLFHLVEEAAHKNAVWPNRPLHPQRFAPLALNLHYVLSTRSELPEGQGPYREQLLMGLAAKALHDHPIIDDHTLVGGVPVMEAPGEDNKLRIALRHIPVSEAITYWTAGSNPLRLSAYYEVSVVLLDPEEPGPPGGRVLTYGIESFIGGLPRLSTSRCTLELVVPPDGTTRTVDVQPAQAPIGTEVTLFGSGLGGGPVSVLLRASGWAEPVELDAGWGVSGTSERVFATVQEHAGGRWIFPGTYTVSVAITRDGTRVVSNETPLQITPRVQNITAPNALGELVVTGGLFQHPTTPSASPPLRAAIGGQWLVEGTPGSLQAGEFAVLSPTQIAMRIPPGAPPGEHLPVRILINGCESAPSWVTVP